MSSSPSPQPASPSQPWWLKGDVNSSSQQVQTQAQPTTTATTTPTTTEPQRERPAAVTPLLQSLSRSRSQSDALIGPHQKAKLPPRPTAATEVAELNNQLLKTRRALEGEFLQRSANRLSPLTAHCMLPLALRPISVLSISEQARANSMQSPGTLSTPQAHSHAMTPVPRLDLGLRARPPLRVTSFGDLGKVPESGPGSTDSRAVAPRQRSMTNLDSRLPSRIVTDLGAEGRNRYSLESMKTKWIVGESPRSTSGSRSLASSSGLDSSNSPRHSLGRAGSPTRSRAPSRSRAQSGAGETSIDSLASASSSSPTGKGPLLHSPIARARQDSGTFLPLAKQGSRSSTASSRTQDHLPPMLASSMTLPPRPTLPTAKSMSVLPQTGSSTHLVSPPRKRAVTTTTSEQATNPRLRHCDLLLPSPYIPSTPAAATSKGANDATDSESDDEVHPSAVASALQYYRTSPSRPPTYDGGQRLPCELCGALILRWAILLPCGHRACTACCCSGVNQVSTTPPREHTCAACSTPVQGISLSLPAAEAARAAAMPVQEGGRSVFSLPSNEGDRASPRRQRERSAEMRRFPGVTEALLGLSKPLPAETASKTLTQVAEELEVDKYMSAYSPPQLMQPSPETTFNTDESMVLSEHASFYRPKHVGQAALAGVIKTSKTNSKLLIPTGGFTTTNITNASAAVFHPAASAGLEVGPHNPNQEPFAVVRMDNIPWRTSYHDVIQWIPEADTLLPDATTLPQPVHIPLDLKTGKTANSAFIELRSPDAAKKLIRKRNNTKLMGRPVSLLLSSYDELLSELFPARDPLPLGVTQQHAAFWTPWQLDQLLHLMDFGAPQLKSPIKPIELTISLVELAPAELPTEHKLVLAERTLEVYCQGTQWLTHGVEGLSDALDRLVLAIASCAVLSADLKGKLLEYIRHLSSRTMGHNEPGVLRLMPPGEVPYPYQPQHPNEQHQHHHAQGHAPQYGSYDQHCHAPPHAPTHSLPPAASGAANSRDGVWPAPISTVTDAGHYSYAPSPQPHQYPQQLRSAPPVPNSNGGEDARSHPLYRHPYPDGSVSATMARQDSYQQQTARPPYPRPYDQHDEADFSPVVESGHHPSPVRTYAAPPPPQAPRYGPLDSVAGQHGGSSTAGLAPNATYWQHSQQNSRRGSFGGEAHPHGGASYHHQASGAAAATTSLAPPSASPFAPVSAGSSHLYDEAHFEHLVNSVASRLAADGGHV